MDLSALGSLRVSRLVLGCGNFGGIGSAPAFHGLGETEAQAIDLMDRAWEGGINAFDTADAYGGGRSEDWIGRWLRSRGSLVRDRLVLTSKVFNPVGYKPDTLDDEEDWGQVAKAGSQWLRNIFVRG